MKHDIQDSGDEEVGWIPVGSRSGSIARYSLGEFLWIFQKKKSGELLDVPPILFFGKFCVCFSIINRSFFWPSFLRVVNLRDIGKLDVDVSDVCKVSPF